MIERVRSLLRLAQSDNPHEAESARAEAQRLMRKHGVSAAELEEPEVPACILAEMGAVEVETTFLAMLTEASHHVHVVVTPGGRVRLYGPAVAVGVAAKEWARVREEMRKAFADALAEDERVHREAEETRLGYKPGDIASLFAVSMAFGAMFQRRLADKDREGFYFGFVQALGRDAAVARRAREHREAEQRSAPAQRLHPGAGAGAAATPRDDVPAEAPALPAGRTAPQVPGLVLVRREERRRAAPEGPQAPQQRIAVDAEAVRRGVEAARRLRQPVAPARPPGPFQQVVPWRI